MKKNDDVIEGEVEHGAALAKRGDASLATVNTANPIGMMLQTIIDKGITADTAATMEKLTDLYLKVEANNARKEYAEAMADLQAELPVVAARREVKGNDGGLRYRFASYEDIMAQIKPTLTKHGFSIKATARTDDKHVTAVLTITHRSGHSEQNEFAVRAGKGPPGTNEAQADGSNAAYAQRYALCDALNISIRKDDDARADGGFITAAQASDLRRKVAETRSNEAAFLKFAGADTYETIRSGKLTLCVSMLVKKMQQQAAAKPTTRDDAPLGEPDMSQIQSPREPGDE